MWKPRRNCNSLATRPPTRGLVVRASAAAVNSIFSVRADDARSFPGGGDVAEANDRSSESRVPGLDLLRLAAVAAVILYHYGFWGPASNGAPQVALPDLAALA